MTTGTRRNVLAVLLLVLTAAVYAATLGHDFVNYDDREYLLENRAVRAGFSVESVTWAFTTTATGNWHPVTWLSHLLDVRFFGFAPGGHHLTSLLIHLANVLLLLLVLRGMTGALWPSGLVAALFAVHPLHVESVAWVAERKDVLCAFFSLLTLQAYLRFAAQPGTRRYLKVTLFLALALLSKPMAVTLPVLLLLLDYWPLGRLFPPGPTGSTPPGARHPSALLRLIREKTPWFALSAAASVVTYAAQAQSSLVRDLEHFSLVARIANALTSTCTYIGSMFWPRDLAVFYPHPGAAFSTAGVIGAGACLALATLMILRSGTRFPYLITGWFWYLAMLVPVIGLIQVGGQARADRYTYLPLVGLFLALAWGWIDLAARLPGLRAATVTLGCLVPLGLAGAARVQVGYWENSVRLFEHALAVTAGNALSENNLGLALAESGRSTEAIMHYTAALYLKPRSARILGNLGLALANQGRLAEAIARYREALAIDPRNSRIHNNLGTALDMQGNLEKAATHFREAVRLAPESAQAHNNLGTTLARQGRLPEAVARFREAIRIDPAYTTARSNLEMAMQSLSSTSSSPGALRSPRLVKPDE